MSAELVMPCSHLILCRPLLLLPSIFPRIKAFSNESVLHIRWPKYWSFSISISPSNEYSGLISFRIDWFDLLAVRGTLRAFWLSAFFIGYKCSTLHNDAKLPYTMMIPVQLAVYNMHSFCSTFWSTLDIVRLLNFCQLPEHKIPSHQDFDLHFADYPWGWAALHKFIAYFLV